MQNEAKSLAQKLGARPKFLLPFESLLDTFTLLSFLLIIVAIIQANRVSSGDTRETAVALREPSSGGNAARAVPKGVVLLALFRDGGADKLSISDGTQQSYDEFFLTPEQLPTVLTNFLQRARSIPNVHLAVYEGNGKPSPGLLVALQHHLWLNGCKGFKMYFVEK